MTEADRNRFENIKTANENRIKWLEYNLQLAARPSSGGCITCAYSDLWNGELAHRHGICNAPIPSSADVIKIHNINEGFGVGCPCWKPQQRAGDRIFKMLYDA